MAKMDISLYQKSAVSHLDRLIKSNHKVMEKLARQIVQDVRKKKSLLIFGSGHSGLFPLELYHRAGGASFVLPLVADHLLPTAGPPVVRILERTPGAATMLLDRYSARKGEMLWLASQSGINSAAIDLAIEAKKRGLTTVAFTSLVHSQAVKSRHPSGMRLFEVCDETVDLGGFVGDASVDLKTGVSAGPLSNLGAVFLGHSILVAACKVLETSGVRCVYTSVNTPDGEKRNRKLERVACKRDFLLRG